METAVSPLASPPSLPPLGLVSWWPALPGREPIISHKPRSLRELQVGASVVQELWCPSLTSVCM